MGFWRFAAHNAQVGGSVTSGRNFSFTRDFSRDRMSVRSRSVNGGIMRSVGMRFQLQTVFLHLVISLTSIRSEFPFDYFECALVSHP